MSSLRNSLHRRNHKERSQLQHRSRLGTLEKHKDYVLRARDYHSKRDRIQRLRQKAADRNKDEFYFAMKRQKTQGGVHIQDRGNISLPADIVKVLKTQDENYIRTMRNTNSKAIDRVKEELTTLADLTRPAGADDMAVDGEMDQDDVRVLQDAGVLMTPASSRRRKSAPRSTKHILFTEVGDPVDVKSRKRQAAVVPFEASSPSIPHVDLGWKTPAPSTSRKIKRNSVTDQSVSSVEASEDNSSKTSSSQNRTQLIKELGARLKRDMQLKCATRELEMQRLLMGKGARKKLRGVEKVEGEDEEDGESDDDSRSRTRSQEPAIYRPRVYKWRVERKK